MHNCSLQPATAKTSTTKTFLKLLRKERTFSNFEKLTENILFYRLKSRISDFNKNGIHAKYFLLVFWKVARKRHIIKPFNRVTGLLPRIHVSKKFPTLYFFKGCALLKVLEHSQKKFFSRDTFKRFELFNLSSFDVICPAQSTTNSYTEKWNLRECFLWVLLVSKSF